MYLNKRTNILVKIGMSWILYQLLFKFFKTFTLENSSKDHLASFTNVLNYSFVLKLAYNIINCNNTITTVDLESKK